jgi:hypothetical protein
MPRRGENIHKRKDGRWEARTIDFRRSDGKAHYKSVYAPSYTEVKAKKDKAKAVPKVQRQLTSLLTTEQLFLMWLDDKRVQVKESTHATYHQVIHGHLIPYFQGRKSSYLTNEAVNQFGKDKLDHGRLDGRGGLSAKRVCDMLTILLQIVQYGEKKGAIAGFDYDIARPKTEWSELVVLTHNEQEKLLHHVKATLDHKKTWCAHRLLCRRAPGRALRPPMERHRFQHGHFAYSKDPAKNQGHRPKQHGKDKNGHCHAEKQEVRQGNSLARIPALPAKAMEAGPARHKLCAIRQGEIH